MGLDMYLMGEKYFFSFEDEVTEDGFKLKSKKLELGYWRKHPDLHGYIVETFAEGKDDCNEIELSQDDVLKIIQAIKEKNLPKTTGFFFGESDESDDAPSIEILEKALEWASVKERNISRSLMYVASW